MKQLTIEHLAPYLPYGLKVVDKQNRIWELLGLYNIIDLAIVHEDEQSNNFEMSFLEIKPILKPLSDLVNYYNELIWGLCDARTLSNYNDSKFYVDEIIKFGVDFETHWYLVRWLFQNHFDVFDLIDKNLAVDLNSIKGNMFD